jgi:hypothetical protein
MNHQNKYRDIVIVYLMTALSEPHKIYYPQPYKNGSIFTSVLLLHYRKLLLDTH